jgi:hypothetical protein
LEKFLKAKKFDIAVDNEIKNLKALVQSLEIDGKDRKLSERCTEDVFRCLERIDKKYKEDKEELDSAVTNFKFNPDSK